MLYESIHLNHSNHGLATYIADICKQKYARKELDNLETYNNICRCNDIKVKLRSKFCTLFIKFEWGCLREAVSLQKFFYGELITNFNQEKWESGTIINRAWTVKKSLFVCFNFLNLVLSSTGDSQRIFEVTRLANSFLNFQWISQVEQTSLETSEIG